MNLLKILFSLFICLFGIRYSFATQLIDLSYPFDENTIYWPTEKGFKRQTVFWGNTPNDYFYSAFKFCAPEHGGTHIDAPIHFKKNGMTVDKIPLSQLIGLAVVIDVTQKVKSNDDYQITSVDIKQFETQYRKLTKDDIVIFRTGWGKYWGNKKHYLGTDKLGDITHLHFPGLSKEAAEYLVKRKIKGIAIDTASMDPGFSQDFYVHQIILGSDLYGVENLANVEKLPLIGTKIIIAPMKISGGSGAPTRVIGVID